MQVGVPRIGTGEPFGSLHNPPKVKASRAVDIKIPPVIKKRGGCPPIHRDANPGPRILPWTVRRLQGRQGDVNGKTIYVEKSRNVVYILCIILDDDLLIFRKLIC